MNNQIIKKAFSYIFFGMCILFFGFKSFGAKDQQNKPDYSIVPTAEGQLLSAEQVQDIMRGFQKDMEAKMEIVNEKIAKQEEDIAVLNNSLKDKEGVIKTLHTRITDMENKHTASLEAKDKTIAELKKKMKNMETNYEKRIEKLQNKIQRLANIELQGKNNRGQRLQESEYIMLTRKKKSEDKVRHAIIGMAGIGGTAAVAMLLKSRISLSQ